MTKSLYSTSEVAMLFKVNRVTICRWIKEGEIKAYKIGKCHKISVSDLLGGSNCFQPVQPYPCRIP